MQQVKAFGKKISILALLLIGGTILGLVALLLVHCIPTYRMARHVEHAVPMLEKEFVYGDAVEGYPATFIGSFTDCLMLEHAVYSSEEHSVLEQTMYMYRTESGTGDGWAPGYSLVDYVTGVEQVKEVEYSRYWHGYLVVLKPLLYFLSLNAVRLLASYVQLFLVGLVMMLCFKKGENFLGMSFLATLPFLYFSNLYLSLSLSICFYLLAIFVAVQIKWNDTLNRKKRYEEFFLIAGMATAYFDFLTYPLVVLGFLLCICLYINDYCLKESLKRIVTYSAVWFGGYGGLWAMKWVLTDLLVGGNTIRDALQTILTRTGSDSDQAGLGAVIAQNISAYTNSTFELILLVLAGVIAGMLLVNRKNIRKRNMESAVGILLIGLYPFIWFAFTQNHSWEHWVFTCKILSVSVFALLCAAGKMIRKREVNME